MDAMIRCVAAFVVAVLLPIQGHAAACAQICAMGGKAHASMTAEGAHEGDEHCHQAPAETSPHPEEGDTPNLGLAKCCQAHVFAVDSVAVATGPDKSPPGRATYVSAWSSFIADEPSPPPIAAFTHA